MLTIKPAAAAMLWTSENIRLISWNLFSIQGEPFSSLIMLKITSPAPTSTARRVTGTTCGKFRS
jgi:hypothetical protein